MVKINETHYGVLGGTYRRTSEDLKSFYIYDALKEKKWVSMPNMTVGKEQVVNVHS